MIPSDRANPQVAGVDRMAGRIVGVMLVDGVRRSTGMRRVFKLLPAAAGAGPSKRYGSGYDVAGHISAATPAGPAGFSARLRAIRGR